MRYPLAGISDYEKLARDLLAGIPDRPISLAVFADEPREMNRQARKIASWGDKVYVKIPVTNTMGDSLVELARMFSRGRAGSRS